MPPARYSSSGRFYQQKEDEEGDDAENPEPNSAKAEESATAGEPQFVMAECCKPIPGDSVVGYKDPASHRIIVHKSNCKELDRLAAQFGRNILKDEIKWSQHKAMSYLSTIELRGIDRTGILLDLAKRSARTSASISGRSISRRTTTFSRARSAFMSRMRRACMQSWTKSAR